MYQFAETVQIGSVDKLGTIPKFVYLSPGFVRQCLPGWVAESYPAFNLHTFSTLTISLDLE